MPHPRASCRRGGAPPAQHAQIRRRSKTSATRQLRSTASAHAARAASTGPSTSTCSWRCTCPPAHLHARGLARSHQASQPAALGAPSPASGQRQRPPAPWRHPPVVLPRALQERLACFMGTEESILYSYDMATLPSIIPAFANRKDVIVCDEVRHVRSAAPPRLPCPPWVRRCPPGRPCNAAHAPPASSACATTQPRGACAARAPPPSRVRPRLLCRESTSPSRLGATCRVRKS